MIENIKKILEEKAAASLILKRNLIKEYIQVLTLSFLYSNKKYNSIIFYGGSCLRHCYELPRLSEDLDFVDMEKKIDLNNLSEDLIHFFRKKYGISISAKVQKFRCILKFPILHMLNLANKQESNLLFTKIEVYKEFEFCKNYNIEIKPIFKFGESILVKTFDLSTLMATKILAVLYRKWEKTTKNGKTLAEVKGRDYYDLMWYLKKDVKPNMKCIGIIKEEVALYNELINIVKKINPRSIRYDLEGLIEEEGFIEVFQNNIVEILISLLTERKEKMQR